MNNIKEWGGEVVQELPISSASFVQFDGFIPRVTHIKIDDTGLILTFLFDDGELIYSVLKVDCVPNYVAYVENDRVYGKFICSDEVTRYVENNLGKDLDVDYPFKAYTITSIPSSSGVFTLQGNYGDVSLVTDLNQQTTTNSNTTYWNAVSKPSRVESYQLRADRLYASTTQRKFVEIDPINYTCNVLFTLPQAFTLAATSAKLLGISGNSLYDLTSLPPVKLLEFPETLIRIGSDGTNVVVFSSEHIFVVPPPYTAGVSGVSNTLTSGSALYYLENSLFLANTPGPLDNSQKVADLLYEVDVSLGASTVAGLLSVNGDWHQPELAGLGNIGEKIYGVLNGEYLEIIELDLITKTGTPLNSIEIDESVGMPNCIFTSNISISLNTVQPLKSVNSVLPVNNNIQLYSNNLISLTQTAPNEITVNLASDITNLAILRSQKFE
jgi:hypothetical protein